MNIQNIIYRFCSLALLLTLAHLNAAAQPGAGPAQPVILEHADSIMGRAGAGEVFSGNVRFRQGVATIQTDQAIYYPDTKRVLLTGNVRVVQPGSTLTAAKADYDGNTRTAYASGGLTIQDTGGTITAASGDYSVARKTARFHGGVTYQTGTATLKASEAVYDQVNSHSTFNGNVVYQDGNQTLRAEEGEYYAGYKHALFRRNVIYSDGSGATLRSDAGEFFSGEGRSFFNGNVIMHDANGTILAGAVDYYNNQRRAVFLDGVTVKNDSGTVTAYQLEYKRDTRETFATGNVHVRSFKYGTELFGDTLRDYPQRKYTDVTGNAKMVRTDTVLGPKKEIIRFDTTTLTAHRLEAFRAAPDRYVATDSVHLRRGDMEARAYTARYIPGDSVIGLGSRRIADTTAPPGKDTAAVTGAAHTTLASQPVAWQGDAQLTGDTMTAYLMGKQVRLVESEGNAFAIMRSKRPGRYDQLTGARVSIAVRQDTIRGIQAEGNAASIAFLYDSNRPNGANRVSGDVIRVGMESGAVKRITVTGKKSRNEGEFFPEEWVVGREQVFRLAGFRWVDRNGAAATPAAGDDAGGQAAGAGKVGRRNNDTSPPPPETAPAADPTKENTPAKPPLKPKKKSTKK